MARMLVIQSGGTKVAERASRAGRRGGTTRSRSTPLDDLACDLDRVQALPVGRRKAWAEAAYLGALGLIGAPTRSERERRRPPGESPPETERLLSPVVARARREYESRKLAVYQVNNYVLKVISLLKATPGFANHATALQSQRTAWYVKTPKADFNERLLETYQRRAFDRLTASGTPPLELDMDAFSTVAGPLPLSGSPGAEQSSTLFTFSPDKDVFLGESPAQDPAG